MKAFEWTGKCDNLCEISWVLFRILGSKSVLYEMVMKAPARRQKYGTVETRYLIASETYKKGIKSGPQWEGTKRFTFRFFRFKSPDPSDS